MKDNKLSYNNDTIQDVNSIDNSDIRGLFV